jgi:hypothetical protein
MIWLWRRLTNVLSFRVVASTVGIAIACALSLYLVQRMQISRVYRVAATYARMPADDKQLENWVKAQAGVVPHTVRAERIGNELRVSFLMSQTLSRNPPDPTLSEACERLGYVPYSIWKDENHER